MCLIRRHEKKSQVGVVMIMRRFREVSDIDIAVHTALNVVVCRLQKHREVMLPMSLASPSQSAVQTAAIFPMVAY